MIFCDFCESKTLIKVRDHVFKCETCKEISIINKDFWS